MSWSTLIQSHAFGTHSNPSNPVVLAVVTWWWNSETSRDEVVAAAQAAGPGAFVPCLSDAEVGAIIVNHLGLKARLQADVETNPVTKFQISLPGVASEWNQASYHILCSLAGVSLKRDSWWRECRAEMQKIRDRFRKVRKVMES